MSENELWDVKPTRGIGKLLFGMTPNDVNGYAPQYGVAQQVSKPSETLAVNQSEFAAILAEFDMSSVLSSEEIESASALSSEFSRDLKGIVTETRLEPETLIAEYQDNSLYMLSAEHTNSQIRFKNFPIFETDPKVILQLFQRSNGSALVSGEEVIFSRIGILLSGFYFQNINGSWRYYDAEKDRNISRNITIFEPAKIDQYLDDKFVSTDFGDK